MRKSWSRVRLVIMLMIFSPALLANGIVGVWKNIDDETKQAKALIQISEDANGELSGKIIKLLLNPTAICDKCDGERKNQPVDGMTILWGLRKDGENAWSHGKILDPKKGKVYSANIKLIDGGKRLDVRGYLGISLLGRSQIWERQ